jgi:tetratricopeptide (TPR) repeat protein/transcriptional regulator with XRE-family HTH domain
MGFPGWRGWQHSTRRYDRQCCGSVRLYADVPDLRRYFDVINPTQPTPGSFGEALRQHRVTARLTQEELAAGSGLSVRAIRDLERGRSARPHPSSVRLLAAALKLTAAQQTELSDLTRVPGATAATTAMAVPGQLPGAVTPFVAREPELATLEMLLGQGDGASADATAVITAIVGAAGIGKTALAVHWARRVAASFPDGQIYLNLRGFGPGAPVPAAEAVGTLLAAVGVPPEHWPTGLDAQVGLYRGMAAGRRLLIVLDNARDAEQVRPLLPGSPGGLVLVTSRASLGGLAVSEGAHVLTLGVLSDYEARELLDRRLGTGRMAAEPRAATELIRLCGGLPLALAIASARASVRSDFPLSALADELSDTAGRLDALDAGDSFTSARTVFSWSYQNLPPAAARMFRLLSVHPGPDITPAAAASLAGLDRPQARYLLRELTRYHLLSEQTPGRYDVHDLLRVYAAELAAATDDSAARQDAGARVLDHYLHTAHAAALLYPLRESITLEQPPGPGVTPERLDDQQQAQAWFEAEHHVLRAAVATAAHSGLDGHAWRLAWAMTSFLERRGYWHEQAAIHRTALAAAIRLGDTAGQAAARRDIASACARLGDYGQSRAYLTECLTLYQQIGDRVGEASVHRILSWVAEQQEHYLDALSHGQHALSLSRASGNKYGQAHALNCVGWYHALLGDYQQARAVCQQGLALLRELGDRVGEAHTWDSLGYAEQELGHPAQAISCYQHALSIFRKLRDRFNEAEILAHLGDSHLAAGQQPEAHDAWRQALAILEDLHHPDAGHLRSKLRSPV